MNTKNKKVNTNYVVLGIILVIAVVFLIVLLNIAKDNHKTKPIPNDGVTDEVTTKLTDVVTNKTTTTAVLEDGKTESIVVTNFSASLNTIITDQLFVGNYKVDLYYSGAKFSFNCTNFDENTNSCLSNSGLLNLGNSVIPLFTSNVGSSPLDFRSDFYISVSDRFVIIGNNKERNANVYNRDGSYIITQPSYISSYNVGDQVYTNIFPTLEDNNMYYYYCDNGIVNVGRLNLTDVNDANWEETVEGATCN